jgi:tRNA A-37 threonylcarbamoyl transferase component Bud32
VVRFRGKDRGATSNEASPANSGFLGSGAFGKRAKPSAPVTEAAPLTGVPVIAGFRDLTIIGHGSTATVYRALQDGFDREVAIKVLHLDISDRRAQKRFQRERSLNGRLSNHPNVVTVLDSGFVDGRNPYLVMEFLEEGSLADRLKHRGPFELALVMHIGVRIAGALETAHRIGVLHRDVKPNNILLSRFEEPALADFGIAAILEMEQSFTAALTPVHAAPELLEGSEPSPQTDVYALGSTLYTLLAGAAPFAGPAGEGMLSQLLRITTTDVPTLARSDTPRELIDLLRQSMAKRPEARIGSAREFGERLQALQQQFSLPVSALPVDVLTKVSAPTVSPVETDFSENAPLLDNVVTHEAAPTNAPAAADPVVAAPVVAAVVVAATEPNITTEPILAVESFESVTSFEPAVETITQDSYEPPTAIETEVAATDLDQDTNQATVTFEPIHGPDPSDSHVRHPPVVTAPPPPAAVIPALVGTSAAMVATPNAPAFDPYATISARQLHPPQPPAEKRKRPWWMIPLVIVGSIGTATTASVVLLATGSDGPKSSVTQTSRSNAASNTQPSVTVSTAVTSTETTMIFQSPTSNATPSTVDYIGGASCLRNDVTRCIPGNVLLKPQDGALSVRFTDRTGDQRQHLIKIARGANKKALDPIITQPRQTFLVLPPEIDPNEPICVVVSAVIELPDRFAEAPAVCLNGGAIG